MTLSQLPSVPRSVLDEGVFRCDWSRYSGALKCWRYGWQALTLGRVPAGWQPALGFGSALHEGFDVRQRKIMAGVTEPARMMAEIEAAIDEAFLVDEPCEDCQGKGCEACDGTGAFAVEVQVPDGEHRTAGRAKEVLGLYCERWKDDDKHFEIVASELAAEKELGRIKLRDERGLSFEVKVLWRGKTDGIWRQRSTGRCAVKDSKSMQEGGFDREYSKYKMSGQLKGYCWLFSGREFGPINEAVIDTVIVRKPLAKPSAKSPPRTEFDRAIFSYPDELLEEWRQETLAVIQSWLQLCLDSPGAPPKNTESCMKPSQCSFLSVCEQRTEKDRMSWLFGSSFKDDDWDPMKPRQRVKGTRRRREGRVLIAGVDF